MWSAWAVWYKILWKVVNISRKAFESSRWRVGGKSMRWDNVLYQCFISVLFNILKPSTIKNHIYFCKYFIRPSRRKVITKRKRVYTFIFKCPTSMLPVQWLDCCWIFPAISYRLGTTSLSQEPRIGPSKYSFFCSFFMYVCALKLFSVKQDVDVSNTASIVLGWPGLHIVLWTRLLIA